MMVALAKAWAMSSCSGVADSNQRSIINLLLLSSNIAQGRNIFPELALICVIVLLLNGGAAWGEREDGQFETENGWRSHSSEHQDDLDDAGPGPLQNTKKPL